MTLTLPKKKLSPPPIIKESLKMKGFVKKESHNSLRSKFGPYTFTTKKEISSIEENNFSPTLEKILQQLRGFNRCECHP